jgi:hypothetical protein
MKGKDADEHAECETGAHACRPQHVAGGDAQGRRATCAEHGKHRQAARDLAVAPRAFELGVRIEYVAVVIEPVPWPVSQPQSNMRPQSGVIATKANTATTATTATTASGGLRRGSGDTRTAAQHEASTAAVPP